MSWTLPDNSTLSAVEAQRLDAALKGAWAIPFIRDIEGYIWETIFHYVKGLSISPSSSKDLFDAVDVTSHKGWSLKTLQWNTENPNIEFIIQRADILKKAKELGFDEKLSEASDPQDLGRALVRHWNDKLVKDSVAQKVQEGFLVVLIKSMNRKEYIFVQELIPHFNPDTLMWAWTEQRKPKKGNISKQDVLLEAATDEQRLGLQARNKSDGKVVLKWYIGQKQLFQCLTIPVNAPRFTITPERVDIDSFLNTMITLLTHQNTMPVQTSLFQDDEIL